MLLLLLADSCTARSVKPLVPCQHQFRNFYLFGGYSPLNGDHYTPEFPYCNTDCFEQYLDGLSRHKAGEFKILILDSGAFHKARRPDIPQNIGLLFLPPNSPELGIKRIIISGYGKDNPLNDNDTPENRRIEMKLLLPLLGNQTIDMINRKSLFRNREQPFFMDRFDQ